MSCYALFTQHQQRQTTGTRQRIKYRYKQDNQVFSRVQLVKEKGKLEQYFHENHISCNPNISGRKAAEPKYAAPAEIITYHNSALVLNNYITIIHDSLTINKCSHLETVVSQLKIF